METKERTILFRNKTLMIIHNQGKKVNLIGKNNKKDNMIINP